MFLVSNKGGREQCGGWILDAFRSRIHRISWRVGCRVKERKKEESKMTARWSEQMDACKCCLWR